MSIVNPDSDAISFDSPMARWLATPQGQYVLRWEQTKFDQVCADIFGFNALQLGDPVFDTLRANRIPHRFRCSPGPGGQVRASYLQMPFASQSMDLVVLPHVLEFADNPHQILREADRILMPEGHLLIAGFNPFSLWGAKRAWASRGDVFPWQGQYLSVRRLKDWLQLLGLETQAGGFGCYVPPVLSEAWLKRWDFMARAGDRWWPYAGAVYVIQAIKRVPGMRLIRPAWKKRSARRALSAVVQRDGAPINKDSL
ncbi:MAG: hypothetical protein RIR70_1395 [Pseudomonadota bacterium]